MDVRDVSHLGQHDNVQRCARGRHHLDDVGVGPRRRPVVDPHPAQLARPTRLGERDGDLRAGLGLRVGRDGVLQIEEHLVGGQVLCLLDHLGVAARNAKGTFDGADTRFPQPHSLPSTDMAAVNRVYAARLAGMVVLGPDGESIGRVRDVVISIGVARHQPRVLGLVVELLTRRRIFVPILRVTAIEPSAVTLATGNVSLRRFSQRPGEVLVLGAGDRNPGPRRRSRSAGAGRNRRRRGRSGHRADPHPRLGRHQGRRAARSAGSAAAATSTSSTGSTCRA